MRTVPGRPDNPSPAPPVGRQQSRGLRIDGDGAPADRLPKGWKFCRSLSSQRVQLRVAPGGDGGGADAQARPTPAPEHGRKDRVPPQRPREGATPRSADLCSSVFWMMKMSRRPPPTRERIAPLPSRARFWPLPLGSCWTILTSLWDLWPLNNPPMGDQAEHVTCNRGPQLTEYFQGRDLHLTARARRPTTIAGLHCAGSPTVSLVLACYR